MCFQWYQTYNTITIRISFCPNHSTKGTHHKYCNPSHLPLTCLKRGFILWVVNSTTGSTQRLVAMSSYWANSRAFRSLDMAYYQKSIVNMTIMPIVYYHSAMEQELHMPVVILNLSTEGREHAVANSHILILNITNNNMKTKLIFTIWRTHDHAIVCKDNNIVLILQDYFHG